MAAVSFSRNRTVAEMLQRERATDCQATLKSAIVPCLSLANTDLVNCAGDVVYNQCRMYVGDTTPESRRTWIADLDLLAALK
jgi:hypothetical protein